MRLLIPHMLKLYFQTNKAAEQSENRNTLHTLFSIQFRHASYTFLFSFSFYLSPWHLSGTGASYPSSTGLTLFGNMAYFSVHKRSIKRQARWWFYRETIRRQQVYFSAPTKNDNNEIKMRHEDLWTVNWKCAGWVVAVGKFLGILSATNYVDHRIVPCEAY